MKTYGTAILNGDAWEISAEPHVQMQIKRVCQGIDRHRVALLTLSNTPANCRDLAWFIERYPLEVRPMDALTQGAARHAEHVLRLSDLIAGHTPPPDFPLALPPREYQAVGATVARAAGGLLLADDVGIGKTCTAIATIADAAHLPAVIVAPSHLLRQWAREIARFAPHLTVWTTPGTAPGPMGKKGVAPDVVVTSYHRLHGWCHVLSEYVRSVVYDEVHELRRSQSQKYNAAHFLAKTPRITLRLGLSATPIFNYGGEFFYVLDVLAPGRLGTRSEFLREWCGGDAVEDKATVKDPQAFGAWLRDQGLMLRRTRAEVGRELPPTTTVVQTVDSDPAALEAVGDQVRALARILLGQTPATKAERFTAAGEIDWRLRQATGISKAVSVAAFVLMLVESGEPVILAGWHRAVYDLWRERFTAGGLRVAAYTGDESHAAKEAAATAWRAGEIDVLMLSLRSGAGLDGLQERGSVVVFGELDWSPAVHEQLIGRLHREGQHKNVVAYYLVAEDGADPAIAEALGLKRAQLDGVRHPKGDAVLAQQSDGEHIKRLAARYLAAETPNKSKTSEGIA